MVLIWKSIDIFEEIADAANERPMKDQCMQVTITG